MWLARRKALELTMRFKLPPLVTESELDAVFRRMRIRVATAPIELEVREFRRGRIVGIRCDQTPEWCFWLKAHALGHIMMHRGEQAYMAQMAVDKQEGQAEEFAGWLLWMATARKQTHAAESNRFGTHYRRFSDRLTCRGIRRSHYPSRRPASGRLQLLRICWRLRYLPYFIRPCRAVAHLDGDSS